MSDTMIENNPNTILKKKRGGGGEGVELQNEPPSQVRLGCVLEVAQ